MKGETTYRLPCSIAGSTEICGFIFMFVFSFPTLKNSLKSSCSGCRSEIVVVIGKSFSFFDGSKECELFMHILMVDDSRAQRNATKYFLIELGFKVQEAADATEALRCLKGGEKYDGLLIDWDMPGMDGLQLVKNIRMDSENGQTPIILMGEDKYSDRVGEALEAGTDEFLMKPFSKEVLSTKLELLGIESSSS